MAQHLLVALAKVKAQIAGHLPVDVDQLARDAGHHWRCRKLSPAVTVRLFMLQVLNGNLAMTALRHLSGVSVQASSYCAARARLPLALFVRLFDAVAQMAARQTAARQTGARQDDAATLLNGRRVLLGDATTFSLPDTPRLREHFRYPPDQKPGCGFPMGKLLGVVDAASGAMLTAMGCPLFAHESRSMLSLHPLLRRGDVLVADRGFCSFLQIALLLRHGVDAVLRLHQLRDQPMGADTLDTWIRPLWRPRWMDAATWQSLPPRLTVRIVRYHVPRKGYRTRVPYVATTLLDRLAYPPATIVRLYGHRWNIETCFNQLKTHAKMNTLKSQTLDGVIKELIMYLIVWNLVRMTMARFAAAAGISVWRVSFIDALRWLAALLATPPTTAALLINPTRPGRWEPRTLKRRLKRYDMLNEPRANLKSKHRARYA
jgi:hypothetical protein